MASPEAAALYEQFQANAQPVPENLTVADLREQAEFLAGCATEVDDVERTDVDAGGCPGVLHTPPDAQPGRVLLWLHGGGYNLLTARTYTRMLGHFAKVLRTRTLALDFRRAPEHPFPAALDDAVNAYRWVREQGYDRVVVGGDSAGAGQALATMFVVRESGDVLPEAAVLISGWFDLTLTNASLVTLDERDPINNAPGMAMLRDNYLAGHPADDPLVSPTFGDLTGLPPLYVAVSEVEVLYDDSIALADKARAAGVAVAFESVDLAPHVHTFWAGNLPEANATIRAVADWLAALPAQHH